MFIYLTIDVKAEDQLKTSHKTVTMTVIVTVMA